jgi:hypothetical protein
MHGIYDIGSFGTDDIPSDVFCTGDGPPHLRLGERIQLTRHEGEGAQNGILCSLSNDLVRYVEPEMSDDFYPDIEGQRTEGKHLDSRKQRLPNRAKNILT